MSSLCFVKFQAYADVPPLLGWADIRASSEAMPNDVKESFSGLVFEAGDIRSLLPDIFPFFFAYCVRHERKNNPKARKIRNSFVSFSQFDSHRRFTRVLIVTENNLNSKIKSAPNSLKIPEELP